MESLGFEGYGLTTASILYHRPDYRWLLQAFVWQDYDRSPKFPKLRRFLNFWQHNLDGPLHSVRVVHSIGGVSCLILSKGFFELSDPR